MGIVFTKTSRRKEALQNCKNSLENLLKHSVDEGSKKIIDNLIRCDKTAIFAKPSEDDSSYVPPNQNQREIIKEMINGLSYVSVPDNLFEFSSYSKFIEFSFMVVKSKIENINSIFQGLLPIKIFSVEMKLFNDLLTNLNSGTKNEELIYLYQFINNKNSLMNDWVSHLVLSYNFSKSSISEIIQISCKTNDVKKDFDKYLELNKQLKENTLLKDNLNGFLALFLNRKNFNGYLA
ncbi:hypothetical protein ACTFIY_000531 [Dictyostelium cf. discoideum]